MHAAACKAPAVPDARGERQEDGRGPDAMWPGRLREASNLILLILSDKERPRHETPHRLGATGVISLAAVNGEPHPRRGRTGKAAG